MGLFALLLPRVGNFRHAGHISNNKIAERGIVRRPPMGDVGVRSALLQYRLPENQDLFFDLSLLTGTTCTAPVRQTILEVF